MRARAPRPRGARGRTDHPRGSVTGQVPAVRGADAGTGRRKRPGGARGYGNAPRPVGVRLGAVRPTPVGAAGRGISGKFELN